MLETERLIITKLTLDMAYDIHINSLEDHVDYLVYGTRYHIWSYPFKLIFNCFKSLFLCLK